MSMSYVKRCEIIMEIIILVYDVVLCWNVSVSKFVKITCRA